MTVSTLTRPPAATAALPVVAGRRRGTPWAALALAAICLVQIGLAVRPGLNGTPFEDEGLYIYMGHRMIAHLLHGAFLSEYPGAYFSGAPGFYPVLAAVGDHFGGLQGARTVSLIFALGATVSVNGLGRQLYSRRAGLLGAMAFVLCGSVIYQSDFATFDSTTLFLIAAAAWLTVYSVRHDRYLWAPVVGVLLMLAFYAKYAGAAYAPVIAALALATASRADRLLSARRTFFMLVSAGTLGYFILALWGRSLVHGIAVTTTSRQVINPASTSSLITQVGLWVGPWLALAALGALSTRRTWAVTAVLLAGAVIGPLQQIRIGESTSLAKHVAFGMIFAAPLVGLLFSWLLERLRVLAVPVIAVVAVCLAASGLHYSQEFLTGWISDAALIPPLERLLDATPGKPILGDQPAAERYALASRTAPLQWTDTYSFSYDHKTGVPAYQEAIDQTSFGVIYLAKQPYAGNPDGSATRNGAFVYRYLTSGNTPYRQVGTVNRVLREQVVGQRSLFIPKAVHLPGEPTVPTLPAAAATPGPHPSATPPPVAGSRTPPTQSRR
jgi:4-amino-4-deoxy-L-arabinose transferase-like glycosyltransferase